MKPYKGRGVEDGHKVKVYRNLNNGLWSIMDAMTGLVLAHSDEVYLTDADFIVNERGRQRVLRERRKNVHAFVLGIYRAKSLHPLHWSEATYNPFRYETFVQLPNEEPIDYSVHSVRLVGKHLFFGPKSTLPY